MASPDQKFQKLLQEVQSLCEKISEYMQGKSSSTGRPWMHPPEWNGDVFDIEGMKESFDRKGPNDEYEAEMEKKSKGNIGVCMGDKVQMDYMGMMERSFRSRNASFIRCYVHSASRRKAHGLSEGVHTRGVLEYVTNLLKAE